MGLTQLITLFKQILLFIGICGVVVIYSGFLYLMFTGQPTVNLSWYSLLSPWVCIYFGLTRKQQVAVRKWFYNKFNL